MKAFLRCLMLIAAIAVPWAMSAQIPTETLIGSESSTTTDKYPVNDYYNYSLSETIIDASEIVDSAQTINSISLYYNYASPMTSKTNCTIYLQHTTKSTFSSSSDIEALSPDAVMVYTGSLNCAQGWNQFDFSNNFSYDGTSNLMVIIDDNSGDYDGSTYVFKTSSCSGYKTLFWYNDNVNPDLSNTSAFSSTQNYYQARCVMKLNGFQGAVSCPRVASISASNVSAYTATVSFTPGGNETAWIGTINPPLFGQSSIVLNDTIVNLMALTPTTDYTVSVSAICGAGDTSMPRSIDFRTTCAPYSIPFTENFDAMASNTTPECWTKVGPGTAAINSSTTYSHSGSMTLKFSGASTPDANIIALPQFSAPINTLELTLWTRPESFTNSSCGQFDVGYMTDLTDASTFVALDTYNYDEFSSVEERNVNFSNAPATAIMALRHRANSNSWYWFVDDIDVHTIPSCPKPATVSASTIDAHSGLVQWTPASSDQTNFVVAYGIGTDPTTMATVNATGTSTIISGLTALTNYNVFVKAVCGADDESLWSRMASFSTALDCGTGYELRDFTIGEGTSSSASYTFYASSTYPFAYNAAIFTAEEIGANNLFENNTINALRLHVGATGGTINNAHIYMANVDLDTYTGASDTTLFAEMEEVYSGNLECGANQWVTIPLTTPFTFDANRNLMVRFHHTSTSTAGVSFFYTNLVSDYRNIYGYRSSTGSTASATKSYNRPNIEFMACTEVPSCFPVQNVTANNVAISSADISWTLNDTTQNNFTIAYGTTNDVATMATATVTNDHVTLYSLTPNTTYYVTVRANCNSEDASSWYRLISFHTLCDIADSAIFLEDFDSYTDNTIPDCWDMGWFYQNPSSGVKAQPFITSTTQKYGSTGRSMSLQDQGDGTFSYISTQCLPIDRANKYAVSLQVYRGNYSTMKPNEGIKIWASPSADDTTGATLLGYIHRQYTLEPAVEAIGWYQYEFVIPQSGNQYIFIEGISEYGAATYFDNLEVKEVPCIKNVPYYNDFQNAEVNMVPLCWDNSASTSSSLSSSPQYIWGVYNYNGNNMIRMYNYFVESGYATINTNPLILPSDDTCELKFDISHRASCNPAEILISNDNGATYTMLDAIGQTTSSINKDNPGTFVPKTYNLANYAGDTIIIRFNANANYGSGAIFIDNLAVRPTNNCADPTSVTATTTSANSVLVSWTAGDPAQNNFVVAYGTGNNPDDMDTVTVSGTSAVISGLTFEQTYNFFVKAVCDESHESYWSHSASAHIGYCTPTPSSVDGQGITHVAFGNGDETVDNSQRPTSAPFYGNYSSQIGAVNASDYANIDITYSTGYTYSTIIWVDWDNSLTFDGDEVVYFGESYSSNPTTLNASFLVPGTQDTGYFRMRIAGSDSYYDNYIGSLASAATADPCPSSSYTIVHDYTLHILPEPTCKKPNNVVASNVTNISADITWSTLDPTENNFVVAYGTGTNPDEMTTTTATTNSATITGLNNGTTYNVFVKAVCSSDDESEWSAMCTFTTDLCSEENQCSITISMADEYGDGWNGGSLVVMDAVSNTAIATFELSDGNEETDSVTICKGRFYSLVWQEGDYDNEVSFVVSDANGQAIYSVIEPSAGLLTTFTGSCPITDSNVYVVYAVNNAWMGTTTPVPGQHTYQVGDMLNATATANAGYSFVNWTISADGVEDITISDNPINTMIPDYMAGMDITCMANFEVETFDVTVLTNDANMGTVSGSGSYNSGATATIVATPAANCRFVQWSDGDTNATRNIVVTSDTTLTATFDYQPVLVTYAINNAWMGSTTPAIGQYTYHVGDTVSATATANAGFRFVNWTISNGIISNTNATNPAEIVIPAAFAGMNITITAIFDNDQFTITALSNNDLLGTVTGSGTYNNGATATLVATPAANCHFVQWNDGDTNATRTVVVTSDSTFTATFDYNPINVVLAINNAWMGTTTPAPGAYTFHVGDTVSAMAVANPNYHFVNWNISYGTLADTTSINPAVFPVPAFMAGMNFSVTANFAPDQFNIVAEANNDAMGTVLGSGLYDYGTTATISAVANRNTHFVQWSDGDTNAIRNILVTSDSTFTAIFDYDPITVTLATNNSAMGTTAPVPGVYTYLVDDTLRASAIASTGHLFQFWTINYGTGIDIDTLVSNPMEMVLRNHLAGENILVTACFVAEQHTITAVPNDANMGTVTGGGVYGYGSSVTLTATPADNAYFTNWSDGDTNAIRNIIVTNDAAYVAIFHYNPVNVTLAVNDAAMGTTTPAPGIYAQQVGNVINATATANTGYRFTSWTITGMGDTTISNVNPLDVTILPIAAGNDVTITANFEVHPQHTVTLTIPEIGGTATGSGTYYEGEMVTINAIADDNFIFTGWTDNNGAIVYTNSTNTFVMGTSDIELTANFEYREATLDITINNPAMGYILINGEATTHYEGHINDQVEIVAVANDGYRFVMWNLSADSNSTEGTITYTLGHAVCGINALFAKNLDINDANVDNTVIFSENNNIIVRGAEQQTIRVFDVVGRLVEQRNNANVEETIPMSNTGIYLVKVGDAAARRVVVRR
ncbi:MAG: fibronectin type III domain-containing protein [Bacteroidales bacterium]|nr:fibronectin type III domain-containing protein [Bacteroidales bacterium]